MDGENKMWFQGSKFCGHPLEIETLNSSIVKLHKEKGKNSILKLRTSEGTWTKDCEEVAECLIQYYRELFTSDQAPPCEAATSTIHSVISEEMNSQSSSDFMAWEVQQAIKQMAPLKAPSPDGMPPFFYQHYWDLIGDDITLSILNFLHTASLLEHLNHIFITLIPKK